MRVWIRHPNDLVVKSDGSTQRFYEKVSVLPIELDESKSFAVDIDNRLLQVCNRTLYTCFIILTDIDE